MFLFNLTKEQHLLLIEAPRLLDICKRWRKIYLDNHMNNPPGCFDPFNPNDPNLPEPFVEYAKLFVESGESIECAEGRDPEAIALVEKAEKLGLYEKQDVSTQAQIEGEVPPSGGAPEAKLLWTQDLGNGSRAKFVAGSPEETSSEEA